MRNRQDGSAFCDSPAGAIRGTPALVKALKPKDRPMRTSSGRRFSLLVSLAPDNRPDSLHPTARALELIDAIERSGVGAVPIAWHLPAADAGSGDRPGSAAFRDALRRRVAETGDALLPMGLTGAPHVALHIGEIEADVAWSLSNIWTTGVADALRLDPPLVVPAAPDTLRCEALAAYGAADVPVGILGEDRTGMWISVVPNGNAGTGGALPLLDAAVLSGDEITARALARALARRRREARSLSAADVQIVVRVALGPHDDEQRALALATASAELSGRQGWSLVGLSVDHTPPARVPRLLARARATVAPEVGEHASTMRRRRASKINTRRILEAVAHGDSNTHVGPGTAAPPEDGRREFIASMLGQASIPGTTVEARFDGGRLCGLHGRSTVKPAQPSAVEPRFDRRPGDRRLAEHTRDELAPPVFRGGRRAGSDVCVRVAVGDRLEDAPRVDLARPSTPHRRGVFADFGRDRRAGAGEKTRNARGRGVVYR